MINLTAPRTGRSRSRGLFFLQGCLAVALAVGLWTGSVSTYRELADALRLPRSNEAELGRRVNGPIFPYAGQLEQVLPLDSCLILVDPELQVWREMKAKFWPPSATVLGHALHPRAVRVVADAQEAILASGCAGHEPYILIWIEPVRRDEAPHLEADLRFIHALPNAEQVSSYADEEGNHGVVFLLRALPGDSDG